MGIKDCQIPDNYVKKMVYQLLEEYASNLNNNLKPFVSNLIKEGIVPASEIKTSYFHIGNVQEADYFNCAEICFYEYIGDKPDRERIKNILKLSEHYKNVKRNCKRVIQLIDNPDEFTYLTSVIKAYDKTMETAGNISEISPVFLLYLWCENANSSFLFRMYFGLAMNYNINMEEEILMNCTRLSSPLEEDEEVKFLLGKLERKLEKLAEKPKDEIINDIVEIITDYPDINTPVIKDEYFSMLPRHDNVTKLKADISRVFEKTKFNTVKKAYDAIITFNKKFSNKKNYTKEITENLMNEMLDTNFRIPNLNADNTIISKPNINHEDICTKSEVQQELMCIDLNAFINNVIIEYAKENIRKSYGDILKTDFINRILNKNTETTETSDLKAKIISLMSENEKYYRENIFLKEQSRQLQQNKDEKKTNKLQLEIDELNRHERKHRLKIEELEEQTVKKDIEIALLKEKIEKLKHPTIKESNKDIDTNGRYLFVCINNSTCTKLLNWFPNSTVFNYNKSVNVKSIDAIIVITSEVKHREYWAAKSYSLKHNVPFIHCPVKNYEGICNTIAGYL